MTSPPLTHPICSLCRSDARRNDRLGITYCPIHGHDGRIDFAPGVAREAFVVATVATATAATGGGRA